MSLMPMLLCDCCEGTGYRIWSREGKLRFLVCQVCDAAGTITFHIGAIGFPTLQQTLPSLKESN